MICDHKRIILGYSGGKDSLALLYKARPWLDRITVVTVDPGAVFPHVTDHIVETCRKLGAKLEIVRPHIPVQQWHAEKGLPSDVVPAWHMPEWSWLEAGNTRTPIQPTYSCCSAMLFAPFARYIAESGATLVLRGSKKADERVGVAPGYVLNGVEYASPLWDWSDDDVFAYLEAEGAELPPHYATVKDSLDCWLCTGHTGAHYAADKLRYTRDHHPDLWPELSARLKLVRAAVSSESARHDAVYSVIEEPCA